jgi:hypothetical protein
MRLSFAAWLTSTGGRDANRKVSMSWMITTGVLVLPPATIFGGIEVDLARRAILRAVQWWRMSID